MTDNGIIKALELDKETIVALGGRNGIPPIVQHQDVIDLINRQKEEIDKLYIEIDELILQKDLLFDEAEALIKKSRAEAIKEFAERMKNRLENGPFLDWTYEYITMLNDIEEVEKEMTEEKK